MKTRLLLLALFTALLTGALFSQRPDAATRSRQIERENLAEPYQGIFTSAGPERDLFPIRQTGVSTEPVRKAAVAFLDSLTDEQRAKTTFPVDDDEWRSWMNQHFYDRRGVGFREMSDAQSEAAFALLDAALSARGLALSRDIMRLNHTLGEIQNNLTEYGEDLYFFTVMGEPSPDQPWGWQIDGHHLIVNYFVLGDQVVMTPTFVGSEPVIAEAGKYKGVTIMQQEQDRGRAFLNSLPAELKAKAVLSVSKTGNNNLGEAWKDNFKLDFAGLPVADLSPVHRKTLTDLIELYIGLMKEDRAQVKMADIEKHLDETYFAWIGESEEDSVFYYRIHSPVVLIEFDHQSPAGMRSLYPSRAPIRQHIHAVIRTPNGNDYGKDLLRQHYLRSHAGD